MRVLVAARLSQDRKNESMGAQTGIESQDRQVAEWLRREGHTVVAVVADKRSGTVQPWDRPNLRPWVTDPGKLAQYDAVAGYRFDRLSRGDNRDTNAIEEWAHANGKQLLTEDGLRFPCEGADGIRWDLSKRLAREEWIKISERYRRMQDYLRSENKLVGRPCYGLQRIKAGDHKSLAPLEPQASIVREAVQRYLDGATLDAIVRDFNRRGISGPGGGIWHAKRLAVLLRNPALAGERRQGDAVLTFEGIISMEEHAQLVARLDSRASRKGIAPGRTAMLTSVIRDEHGHAMYRVNGHRADASYRCRECGIQASLEVANEAVSELFRDSASPVMVERLVPGDNHTDEITRLRRERARLDDLAPDYDERHAELTAHIRELARQDEESPSPDRVELISSGQTYGEVWAAMEDYQRNALLKAANVSVVWHKGGEIVISTDRLGMLQSGRIEV